MATPPSFFPDTELTPTQKKSRELSDLADRHIKSARNNPDISVEKRNKIIARAYLDLKDGLDQLEASTKRAADARRSELERSVYGIPNKADASAMISYRDALDRASQVEKEAAAVDLYKRAQTSGDDLLARAVLATAYQNQWVNVINNHAELYPETDAQLNELWNAQSGFMGGGLFDFVAPVPNEIRNHTESSLRVMAEGETPTASIQVF
ncbi:MAG: hypothetical protein Q7T73_03260 [Beijerinckiaceae bacterium]|nr:hypothetical protein [Beijerinckiaceae bacterium]